MVTVAEALPSSTGNHAVDILVVSALAVGALLTLARFAKTTIRLFRRIDEVADDLLGREGQPSLAQRHHSTDMKVDQLVGKVDVIERRSEQLERNGGSRMADAVARMEQGQEQAREQARRAATLAGQAASAAATAFQRADETSGRITVIQQEALGRHRENLMRLDRIEAELAARREQDQRNRDREMAYVASLHELGIAIQVPDDDGEAPG